MLYFLLVINLITFIVFSLDKWKATKHKRRISEFNLLMLTFLGGTVGSISAMLIFRHKISKRSFLWKLVGIVVSQILIVVGYSKFLPENLNLLINN